MSSDASYRFRWSDLAFGSKKPIDRLNGIFIAAPRELSARRFADLVKMHLPKGNIILGLSKEDYVLGLEGQPQFRMLRAEAVQTTIEKVNSSVSKHKIYTLEYLQREASYLFEKLQFQRVLFVNGSWHHSFHLQPTYYLLANNRIDFEMVSPFCNEVEAHDYEARISADISASMPAFIHSAVYTEAGMLQQASRAARLSYDHTHQTGVALGIKSGKGYKLLTTAYNKVVPYQTYALHHGSLREKYFSPPNDLNHYDTIHAEVALLITTQSHDMSLNSTTMFINTLPCPTCGRMVAETTISEVVYQLDHSDGYTLSILEQAGKTVRRVTVQ